MQTMAPNTRGDPKATSSSLTKTTALALDDHHQQRHHHQPQAQQQDTHHHPHPLAAHDAYGNAYRRADHRSGSEAEEFRQASNHHQTLESSSSVVGTMENGKRKHDDTCAINAMEQVLNQADDGQEQEVGLKLLFAASLIQSSKSAASATTVPTSISDPAHSTTNTLGEPQQQHPSSPSLPSTSLPVETIPNHSSHNHDTNHNNGILPTMTNYAPPTTTTATTAKTLQPPPHVEVLPVHHHVLVKDSHHHHHHHHHCADGHASTVTAATASSNDTTAGDHPISEDDHTNEDNNAVSEFVSEPTDLDVLCGRGGLINKHPGNIVYRRVVDHNKGLYKKVPKRHRILVSQSIVQTIQTHGGRFLQSSNSSSGEGGRSSSRSIGWTTVPFRRAVQKTSQALREPSQLGEMTTTTTATTNSNNDYSGNVSEREEGQREEEAQDRMPQEQQQQKQPGVQSLGV